MNLVEFETTPTKVSHPDYDDSFLTTVMPEYSTGEVLLGSAYRRLLLDQHDREINLEDILTLPRRLEATQQGHREMWRDILLERGGLASPPPSGRQKHGLRQLMPLVPEIARYACVLGKKRDRWYPGNLLMQVIGAGVGKDEGEKLASRLVKALKVDDDDDLFALYLNNSLAAISDPSSSAQEYDIGVDSRAYQAASISRIRSPAERFCLDLDAILRLKGMLTRRQWTVLLEALIRIGLTMQILWICRVNHEFWQITLEVVEGKPVPSAQDIERVLWQCHGRQHPILEVGTDSAPRIRNCISNYIQAQMGINLLLFMLKDAGVDWGRRIGLGDESGTETTLAAGIHAFLMHVSHFRMRINMADPRGHLEQKRGLLIDGQHEAVECRTGSSKNLFEFARHSLGQIQPAIDDEKAYDQSYLLVRKNKSARSPWPVRIGPAMLIALVQACCKAQGGVPTSIEDFRDHLEEYGLWVGVGELSQGQVGTDLERLGLVIDSPDAGGGRLLVTPF